MPTYITMPAFGPTMETGTLARWWCVEGLAHGGAAAIWR